jgi:hypothetical protein
VAFSTLDARESENWVNPLCCCFTHVATCVKRLQPGLTQLSDNARESFGAAGSVSGQSLSGQCVLGVHDAVAVPLFGEEALPVGREVSVDGVTRHHGIEARGRPLRLGSQQPAKALRLLLPRAECAGDLDSDLSGR